MMAIEFGRSELTIYAFGTQNGFNLFYLDANTGSLIWTYKILNSLSPGNNYLDFNAITANEDMIVFTAI